MPFGNSAPISGASHGEAIESSPRRIIVNHARAVAFTKGSRLDEQPRCKGAKKSEFKKVRGFLLRAPSKSSLLKTTVGLWPLRLRVLAVQS